MASHAQCLPGSVVAAITLSRRRSLRRRSPCRSCGRGRAPRGPARWRRRAGPVGVRAEPVQHLVVEVGLAQHRQPGEEVARRDLLAGGDQCPLLDGVDEQREVDAAQVLADGLGGGGAQQVGRGPRPRGPPRRSRTRPCRRARRPRSPGRPRGPRPPPLPGTVARCSAAAAIVSAPAIANRARHAGALVDGRGLAQRAGEAGQDLDQVVGHLGDQVGLLADHRDLVLELDRVVGADLGAEAVLERRDDAAAVGVVLRVGAGHDEHVERQPQHVAADLDVALLHHVEHRHLDPLGEVGQLVDRDDAAVAARDQPEVDRLGVAEAAPLGDLHRVDVTDQVGDRGVRGGQLLGVPLGAVPPRDRQRRRRARAARRRDSGRDRVEGVLAELGAGDHRRPLVEQADQGAQQPGLALAALAEQHDVVPGDQRPLELRDDGVLEAVQAGPRVVAARAAWRAGCRGARRAGASARVPRRAARRRRWSSAPGSWGLRSPDHANPARNPTPRGERGSGLRRSTGRRPDPGGSRGAAPEGCPGEPAGRRSAPPG